MKEGIVPGSSVIDTDVRWNYSHIKGWIEGYLDINCFVA
jgi:hypothetical protein